ncbi:MAG TPA: T9SS type A sorting domain-containing protein [Anseongella sp.]
MLMQLEITRWNYKRQPERVTHIGPRTLLITKTMKKIYTAIFLLAPVAAVAQEAIIERQLVASVGINNVIGNTIVQSTLGEAVILTVQGARALLSQGFQQPEVTSLDLPPTDPRIVDFIVYPNPASSEAWLEFDLLDDARVNVLLINNAGQVMNNEAVDMLAGKITRLLPVSGYAAGMYYVVLKVKYKTYTQKLVIQ